MTTWASSTSRRIVSRPSSVLRSTTAQRFPRDTSFQYSDVPSAGSGTPMPRVLSPLPGRSILSTSAP